MATNCSRRSRVTFPDSQTLGNRKISEVVKLKWQIIIKVKFPDSQTLGNRNFSEVGKEEISEVVAKINILKITSPA